MSQRNSPKTTRGTRFPRMKLPWIAMLVYFLVMPDKKTPLMKRTQIPKLQFQAESLRVEPDKKLTSISW